MLPDCSVDPGNLTSFNHCALGAVAPAAPGHRELQVAPRPGPGISSAWAGHDTPYGRAAVSWVLTGRTAFTLELTVPAGTTATVQLPDGSEPAVVGSGAHTFACTVDEPQPVETPALFFDPDHFQG